MVSPSRKKKNCYLILVSNDYKPVNGKFPQIPDDCFVAENATTVVGDVVMGRQCSIWFNAVVRGDVHFIKMGDKVNVQDGAVIHATYQTSPTTIGNNVSIGHNAIVHGCTIHDNVLIGMGSIVMDDCVIESNSIIAAGAVLTKIPMWRLEAFMQGSGPKSKRGKQRTSKKGGNWAE